MRSTDYRCSARLSTSVAAGADSSGGGHQQWCLCCSAWKNVFVRLNRREKKKVKTETTKRDERKNALCRVVVAAYEALQYGGGHRTVWGRASVLPAVVPLQQKKKRFDAIFPEFFFETWARGPEDGKHWRCHLLVSTSALESKWRFMARKQVRRACFLGYECPYIDPAPDVLSPG